MSEFSSLHDDETDSIPSESFVHRVLRQRRERRQSGYQVVEETPAETATKRQRQRRRRKLRNAENVRKIMSWFSESVRPVAAEEPPDAPTTAKDRIETSLGQIHQQIQRFESSTHPFVLPDETFSDTASPTRCEPPQRSRRPFQVTSRRSSFAEQDAALDIILKANRHAVRNDDGIVTDGILLSRIGSCVSFGRTHPSVLEDEEKATGLCEMDTTRDPETKRVVSALGLVL